MQSRRVFEGGGEIAGFGTKEEVGDEKDVGQQALTIGDKLGGDHQGKGGDGGGGKDGDEGGQDAADAAFVKAQDGKAVVGNLGQQDGGDEIA